MMERINSLGLKLNNECLFRECYRQCYLLENLPSIYYTDNDKQNHKNLVYNAHPMEVPVV